MKLQYKLTNDFDNSVTYFSDKESVEWEIKCQIMNNGRKKENFKIQLV